MKCDNCGEEIKGPVVDRPDGQVWCIACAKKEKPVSNRRRARTKDRFVITSRHVRDAGATVGVGERDVAQVIAKGNETRIYTNGHVLMSETVRMPRKYKLINIDTLWESDTPISFPDINRVVQGMPDGTTITIPEEFYKCVSLFKKSSPTLRDVTVEFRKNAIHVVDIRDDSLFQYSTPCDLEEGDVRKFAYRYIDALKPRELMVRSSDMSDTVMAISWILGSYEKGLNSCAVVLLAEMFKL